MIAYITMIGILLVINCGFYNKICGFCLRLFQQLSDIKFTFKLARSFCLIVGNNLEMNALKLSSRKLLQISILMKSSICKYCPLQSNKPIKQLIMHSTM